MLILDHRAVGNRLLAQRRRLGLTQSEVAELAGLSNRTYADIERGTVNMRMETALRICHALQITPNAIFTEENTPQTVRQEELLRRLAACTPHEQETALRLLVVYLQSLNAE